MATFDSKCLDATPLQVPALNPQRLLQEEREFARLHEELRQHRAILATVQANADMPVSYAIAVRYAAVQIGIIEPQLQESAATLCGLRQALGAEGCRVAGHRYWWQCKACEVASSLDTGKGGHRCALRCDCGLMHSRECPAAFRLNAQQYQLEKRAHQECRTLGIVQSMRLDGQGQPEPYRFCSLCHAQYHQLFWSLAGPNIPQQEFSRFPVLEG